MDHSDIRHKLSEYMDGTTAPEEKAAIEEHLKSCSECSNALTELRKTVELIKQTEEVNPPAWMTQKIMARVRGESAKKTLLDRLLFPLHIKLPLEAAGVLFLAVTVYFLYQNIQPSASKYSDTSIPAFSGDKTQPGVPEKNRPGKRSSAAPPRGVPQAPEYKALDMKREYESVPPPVPKDEKAAVPTPLPHGEQAAKEASPEKGAGVPRAASPGIKRDQSLDYSSGQVSGRLSPTEKRKKAYKQESLGRTAPAESGRLVLSIAADDVAGAGDRVEKVVKQVGGSVLQKEATADGSRITLSLSMKKRAEFVDKLKTVGELKQGDASSDQKPDNTIPDNSMIEVVVQLSRLK